MEELQKKLRSGVSEIITGDGPGVPGDVTLYQLSKHPQREMLFALTGKCCYYLNGRFFNLTPGMLVLIDKWCPHPLGYTRYDHDMLHLWAHLSEKSLTISFVRVWSNGNYRGEGRIFSMPFNVRALLLERWNRLTERRNPDSSTVRSLMLAPLNLMLDEVALQLQSPEQIPENATRTMLESVKNYIRMHNGRDCSLDALARFTGYSKYHIAHRFREFEGTGPGTFIREIRLEYTRLALERGLKKKEIADELGFSSASNLIRWLAKEQRASRNSK